MAGRNSIAGFRRDAEAAAISQRVGVGVLAPDNISAMDVASDEGPSSSRPARDVIQRLRRRVDLIIVPALRECEQLCHIDHDPGCRGR